MALCNSIFYCYIVLVVVVLFSVVAGRPSVVRRRRRRRSRSRIDCRIWISRAAAVVDSSPSNANVAASVRGIVNSPPSPLRRRRRRISSVSY